MPVSIISGSSSTSGVPLIVYSGTTYTVPTNTQVNAVFQIYLQGSGTIYCAGTGLIHMR